MRSGRWTLLPLLAVAGLAIWLLLASPQRLLGIDTGNLGVALLVICAWVSLWMVGSLAPTRLEGTASPGEWQAWIGCAFLALAVTYFAAKLPVFAVAGPIHQQPEAAAVGRNVVLLVVAWAIVASVLSGRWRQRVQADERDRQIAARAGHWARGALVAFVIGLAVLLAFSPGSRLQWATLLLLANLLMLGLLLSTLVESAVTAASYWRDRR